MDKLKVMIVDDEKSVRTGLEIIINAEPDMFVSAIALNGRSALDTLSRHTPDMILIDIQMPVMDGLECIPLIRERHPELPILILTTFNESDYIIRGLALGAGGYVIKGKQIDRLTQNIRDVYQDRFVLPVAVARKLSEYIFNKPELLPQRAASEYRFPPGLFTKKEQDLLLLLQTNIELKEIATRCAISEGTMRNYMTKIYRKLHVANRKDAQLALQQFVITPSKANGM
jgi:DNA-binding NarL/FixJ family response regulator